MAPAHRPQDQDGCGCKAEAKLGLGVGRLLTPLQGALALRGKEVPGVLGPCGVLRDARGGGSLGQWRGWAGPETLPGCLPPSLPQAITAKGGEA